MDAMRSHARLVLDLLSMKLFVWMLGGGDGELLDSHLFFFDRYSDLADYHRAKGHVARADRFAAIAEAHYQAAPGDDDPLKTAAMAMPAPRPPINTNIVSTTRVPKSDRKPSSIVPPPVPAGAA